MWRLNDKEKRNVEVFSIDCLSSSLRGISWRGLEIRIKDGGTEMSIMDQSMLERFVYSKSVDE